MSIIGPNKPVSSRARIAVSGEFGVALASILRDKGLAHAELARRMDIQRETLFKYIACMRAPTPEFCVRVCSALKLGPKQRFQIHLAAARTYGYILPPKEFADKGDSYVQAELKRLHR